MSACKSRESLPAELDTAAQGVHDSGEHGRTHIKLRKHGIGIRKSSTSAPTIYSQSLPSEAFISRASGHNTRPDASAADATAGASSPLDDATRAPRAAALRRLNGAAAKSPRPSAAAHSKPVLVRSHSVEMPSSKAAIADAADGLPDRSAEKCQYELPPLEAFAFQEILQSVSSDIRVPIDRIAEICGKSRLSLANEYSSHMPPQAEFTAPSFHRARDSVDAVFRHRLLPVEEATSSHERLWEGSDHENDPSGRPMHDKRHSRAKSASWALLGARPSGQQEPVPRTAAAIAETSQTSQVSSSLECLPNAETRPRPLSPQSSERPASSVDFTAFSSLVPSWLRNPAAHDRPPSPGGREASAKEALNRLLGK
ncbi:MAG: hypothetical protein FRX48_02823 [Lasallia pustulata]|uniref:Uncharacterized protein n=1 Tax=Lasallia pustulata TaxID=136370 RepID=A0A5M8PVK5_9LECA|nr:MAG: hypothetical protein FRX48_02823 [Lasallia pustulata]